MPAGVQRLYVPDSAMDVDPRHYGWPAADRETVRSAPMGKVQRLAEMTSPPVTVSNRC